MANTIPETIRSSATTGEKRNINNQNGTGKGIHSLLKNRRCAKHRLFWFIFEIRMISPNNRKFLIV
jgi:hypothetical protein